MESAAGSIGLERARSRSTRPDVLPIADRATRPRSDQSRSMKWLKASCHMAAAQFPIESNPQTAVMAIHRSEPALLIVEAAARHDARLVYESTGSNHAVASWPPGQSSVAPTTLHSRPKLPPQS